MRQVQLHEIIACQSQKSDVVGDVFQRLHPSLVSLSYRYLGNSEDAQDVVMVSWMKVLERLSTFQFQHPLSFYAWIKKICVNECHAYKLQKMVERWDLSAQTLEADILGDLDSIRPPLSASSSIFNFDYRVFKKLMRNTCLQTSKGEIFTKPRVLQYAFEYNSVIKNDDTLSVSSLAITSSDRGLSDLYSSVGFLGNNVCTQIGCRIPLSVKYKMDLPVKVFYFNLGSTLYSVSGENNSAMKKTQLEIKGFYEGLLGFRTMNTSPDLKAVKDYRVKGIELGGFLSDRDGALLPHAGLVLKSYKQLGNVRFTSGIYTGKTTTGSPRSIQSALLFTIEVFDLF